jgi:eukaryotic-like serine/threonine-protein kinase
MASKAPSLPAPSSGLLPIAPYEESQRPFEVGEIIGDKYVFERVIAEGGMAVVVAALHQELGETVAIKVLKPAMLVDRDLVTRFAREAKTTVRVRSEYSVKVFDVGVDKRRGPFMVMEHLKGEDLRSLLDRETRLPERRSAELAIQACEALAAAHVLGIIHRDVKPENIFVTTDGQIDSIRVLDFGISKAALTGSVMNTDISLVKTQMLMGSPVYMSPEQMRSSSHVDGRADIWALGISMYEMLAGKPPFVSESVTNLCAMVLEKQPTPLLTENPSVHPDLANIVMKCLRKDPAERYANVGDLATALLAHAPSRARLSVERIASRYEEIGINVPLPTRASNAPPRPDPTTAEIPVSLEEPRVNTRAKTMLLASTVEKRDHRRLGILTAAGTALLLLLGFLVFMIVGTRKVEPTAAVGPVKEAQVSATTIARPSASDQASANVPVETMPAVAGAGAGGAGRPSSAPPPATMHAAAAPVPWRGTVAKPPTKGHSSSDATVAPAAQPPATRSERAKVLDDGPKVRVLE